MDSNIITIIKTCMENGSVDEMQENWFEEQNDKCTCPVSFDVEEIVYEPIYNEKNVKIGEKISEIPACDEETIIYKGFAIKIKGQAIDEEIDKWKEENVDTSWCKSEDEAIDAFLTCKPSNKELETIYSQIVEDEGLYKLIDICFNNWYNKEVGDYKQAVVLQCPPSVMVGVICLALSPMHAAVLFFFLFCFYLVYKAIKDSLSEMWQHHPWNSKRTKYDSLTSNDFKDEL